MKDDEKLDSFIGFVRDLVRHPEKLNKYPNESLVLPLDRRDASEIFTPKRMELVTVIKEKHPDKVHDLADLVRRDINSVLRDLRILEKHGIVFLEKTGRTVRPVVEREVILIPLTSKKTSAILAKC